MTQLKNSKTKEEVDAEERQQLAMIDWHDFVVVETIDLMDGEDLPAPAGPLKVHTLDYTPAANAQRQDGGNLEEETRKAKEAIAQYQLKKTIKSGAATAPTDIKSRTQKCPVCGDMVTTAEFSEHIRLELLDPKFKKGKAQARLAEKDSVFATAEETTRTLRNMAAHRPDIFDPTGENVSVQQNFSLGGKGDDYIPPINLTGSNRPEVVSSQTIFDQVKDLTEHLRKEQVPYQSGAVEEGGYRDVPRQSRIADMSQVPVAFDAVYNPLPTVIQPLAGPNAPVTVVPDIIPAPHYEEQSILVPEDQWARMNPGIVTVHIKVPDSGSEWGLRGQIIQLPLDIRQSIGAIKMRLAGILSGMPVSKMKLKTNEHSVLKDQETLAHYNFQNGTLLDLTVKERGGRRKH
jgi:splicing factor 3A subunit 1